MKRSSFKLMVFVGAILLMFSIFGCGRKKLEDFHNCVIVRQYCGWDNLDAGYYHVKDLTTKKVYRIDVDIQDCDVFSVGDTIR